MPGFTTYKNRVGGAPKLYELLGYSPSRDLRWVEEHRSRKSLRRLIVNQLIAEIEAKGVLAACDRTARLLTISQEFTISVAIAPCGQLSTRKTLYWTFFFPRKCQPDAFLIVRLDRNNVAPLDYYMLPATVLTERSARMKLFVDNGFAIDAFRFDSLQALLAWIERRSIADVVHHA
jgi:hypothetical protein